MNRAEGKNNLTKWTLIIRGRRRVSLAVVVCWMGWKNERYSSSYFEWILISRIVFSILGAIWNRSNSGCLSISQSWIKKSLLSFHFIFASTTVVSNSFRCNSLSSNRWFSTWRACCSVRFLTELSLNLKVVECSSSLDSSRRIELAFFNLGELGELE